jgi:hypothetical protein
MMKIKWFACLSSLAILTVPIFSSFFLSEKTSTAQSQPAWLDAYVEALKDAARPEADEVVNKLTVINNPQFDPNLYWDNQGRVLVATFTTKDGFKIGKLTDKKVWVTVVPKLKDFCTNYMNANTGVNNQNLNGRLEQLLGIIPNSKKTHIAEIWVNPKYLKRPTSNPDPSRYDKDQIVLPLSSSNIVDKTYKDWFEPKLNEQKQEQEDAKNPEKYRSLILQRLTDSNSGNDPYPWTGLGYTFDWGVYPKTDRQTDAGLSEFVIFAPANSESSSVVEVHRVFSTEDYCRKDESK